MRTIMTVDLTEARRGAESALDEARSRQHAVTVCISDSSGVPILVLRDDDARATTVEMAINKAWTAAAHRRTTEQIAKVAQPGQPGFGVNTQHGGRLSLLAGGVPIIHDGQVIGGVGVSGADGETDTAAALKAVAAIATEEPR